MSPAAAAGPERILPLSDPNAGLLEYWLLLKPRLRRIFFATSIAVALTGVATKTIFSQWYQAQAVLRPASQVAPISPLQTLVNTNLLSQSLSAISSATGLNEIPSDAAQFMAVLSSYEFTSALISRYKLGPMLDQTGLLGTVIKPLYTLRDWVKSLFSAQGGNDQMWYWYQKMSKRFDQDYDSQQGNLTLRFEDRDPNVATQVLGFYLSDLRQQLRQETIRSTASVIASLTNEMGKTSDPLVEQQLAGLIGQEIEQEKEAEAESDFAFTVVDRPFVSADVYSPNTLLDCAIVLVLVPVAMVGWIVFREAVYEPLRRAEELAVWSPVPGPDAVPAYTDRRADEGSDVEESPRAALSKFGR
jgi:hypothetical protein